MFCDWRPREVKFIFHCVKLCRNYFIFFYSHWENHHKLFNVILCISWTVCNMSLESPGSWLVKQVCVLVWVLQRERRKPFRPRHLCVHMKIYCLPENNGTVELVQVFFFLYLCFFFFFALHCRLETNQLCTIQHRTTICYGRQKIYSFRWEINLWDFMLKLLGSPLLKSPSLYTLFCPQEDSMINSLRVQQMEKVLQQVFINFH
jgi:hypothetical protein